MNGLPILDELPGQAVAAMKEIDGTAEAQRKLEQTGRFVWPMHSRPCRRRMQFKLKIRPEQLQLHMAACTCGWPDANFGRWQREQAEREKAAEQAMLDKHVEDCDLVVDGTQPCSGGADS